MGRVGQVEYDKNRPSIITIMIIIAIAVILSAVACVSAYNLVKKSSTKAENERIKEEIISKKIEEIENDSKIDDVIKDNITIKTSDEIKEENQEYTENYKKYQELPKEEKEKQEVIPKKFEVEYEEINNIVKKEEENKEEIKEEIIPDKFDLRDKIEIEVRNQKSFGLCWDFTLVKCIETNLALKTGKYYDLSEIYVDYMLSSELTEGNFLRAIHNGGNGNYIKEIEGIPLESELPYQDYSIDKYGSTIKNIKPYVYVNDYVEFPTNHGSTEEEIKLFRDTVKKHIMNNGSVYCSICSPNTTASYVNKNNVYYSGTEKIDGYHAVSIIGWDDNYSKTNFDCENKPKKDGAYIAVNSWGYGNQEVLYISYEDVMVEKEMVGVLDVSVNESNIKIKNIKFEDENLYNLLKERLSYYIKESNDDEKEIKIKEKDISKISWIAINDIKLVSLKGIENFTDLKTLNINDCEINDITSIQYLTKLESLTISNCNISDINFIKNLNALKELNINKNNIKDISVIKNLKELKSLSISDNPIENINSLKEVKNLTLLNAANIGLTNEDLNIIVGMDDLFQLNISNNNLDDISQISKKNELIVLDVSGNNINKGFTIGDNLSILQLNNCNIQDLSIIKNIDKLRAIYLKNNDVLSIKTLNKLKNAQCIDLSGNKNIVDLRELTCDVSNLTLSECNIESLSQIGNSNVLVLDIKNNNIEYIGEDFEFGRLFNLDLNGNKIKDIENLNKIKTLRFLHLENCGLEDVSKLSELTSLENLYLDGNKNVKGYNQIKSLREISLKDCQINNNSEIFNNRTISNIDIRSNDVTYIDPSFINNDNLYGISLDADKIENISELYCNKRSGLSFYCQKITIKKELVLPQSEKVVLKSTNSGGIIGYDYIANKNCICDGKKIIIDTSNKSELEVEFTEKKYDAEIKYVLNCTIDPYYYYDDIKVTTNKYFNKYILETGEKNFEILDVEVIYPSIDQFTLKSYEKQYYIVESELAADDEILNVYFKDTSAPIKVNTFNLNDMKDIQIEDLYEFNTFNELIGYEKIYNVDYENRITKTQQEKLDSIDCLSISDKFIKTPQILELFTNVKHLQISSNKIELFDTSLFSSFDNVEFIDFDYAHPDNLIKLLEKGIKIRYYGFSNNDINSVDENVVKIDNNKFYLPDCLYELHNNGYKINVTAQINKKDRKVDIYSDYKPEIEITNYIVDDTLKKLYIDGIKYDSNKTFNIIVEVEDENIEQYLLQIIF